MERASPNFSHTLRVVPRRRFQPNRRLARAFLNSVVPVLKDRFAPSRRNCMATRGLLGGGGFLRIESPPSRPLSFVKRTGRKERFGFLRTNTPCRRSGSGQKRKETNHGQGCLS